MFLWIFLIYLCICLYITYIHLLNIIKLDDNSKGLLPLTLLYLIICDLFSADVSSIMQMIEWNQSYIIIAYIFDKTSEIQSFLASKLLILLTIGKKNKMQFIEKSNFKLTIVTEITSMYKHYFFSLPMPKRKRIYSLLLFTQVENFFHLDGILKFNKNKIEWSHWQKADRLTDAVLSNSFFLIIRWYFLPSSR